MINGFFKSNEKGLTLVANFGEEIVCFNYSVEDKKGGVRVASAQKADFFEEAFSEDDLGLTGIQMSYDHMVGNKKHSLDDFLPSNFVYLVFQEALSNLDVFTSNPFFCNFTANVEAGAEKLETLKLLTLDMNDGFHLSVGIQRNKEGEFEETPWYANDGWVKMDWEFNDLNVPMSYFVNIIHDILSERYFEGEC